MLFYDVWCVLCIVIQSQCRFQWSRVCWDTQLLHCSEPKQLVQCINEKVLSHVSLAHPWMEMLMQSSLLITRPLAIFLGRRFVFKSCSFCHSLTIMFMVFFSESFCSSSPLPRPLVTTHTSYKHHNGCPYEFSFCVSHQRRKSYDFQGDEMSKWWQNVMSELGYPFNCWIWPLTLGTQVIKIINYDLKFNVRFYYLCQLEKSVCRSRFSGISNGVDLTQFCRVWSALISTTESVCFCGLQRIPFHLQMFTHESLLQSNA